MNHTSTAKQVLSWEAAQLEAASTRLDEHFNHAVETILSHRGNIIVCGIGKSGAIGQKLTATLCSTGTRAVFLHAAEAVHGDLGVYAPGDPVILISKSGATPEMVRLIPWFKEQESTIIALVGNRYSPVAEKAHFILDATVEKEADTLNLVPTASTTLALALGDALAVALMQARNFTAEAFAKNHPGGQLGRNLGLLVSDVMHQPDKIAILEKTASFRELVIALTTYNMGAACIVENNRLCGLVTDGDVRRALLHGHSLDQLFVADMMTTNPISVKPDATLQQAAELMENRPSQISVLPVCVDGICLGLIRIHDIYHP